MSDRPRLVHRYERQQGQWRLNQWSTYLGRAIDRLLPRSRPIYAEIDSTLQTIQYSSADTSKLGHLYSKLAFYWQENGQLGCEISSTLSTSSNDWIRLETTSSLGFLHPWAYAQAALYEKDDGKVVLFGSLPFTNVGSLNAGYREFDEPLRRILKEETCIGIRVDSEKVDTGVQWTAGPIQGWILGKFGKISTGLEWDSMSDYPTLLLFHSKKSKPHKLLREGDSFDHELGVSVSLPDGITGSLFKHFKDLGKYGTDIGGRIRLKGTVIKEAEACAYTQISDNTGIKGFIEFGGQSKEPTIGISIIPFWKTETEMSILPNVCFLFDMGSLQPSMSFWLNMGRLE